MYALYQVTVWIKAEIEAGTTLEKVISEIDNLPSGKVNFIENEDYLTKTEKFINNVDYPTLKILSDNGKLLYKNKEENGND